MDFLIKSFVITSVVFLIDRWGFKRIKPLFYYLVIFALIFCVEIIFHSKVQASEFKENHFIPSAYLEKQALEDLRYQILTDYERQYYQEKAKKFLKDGEWCLKEAEKKCLYLPSRRDREYTKGAIVTALTALITADVKSTVVVGLITMLGDYFQDVYCEWEDIHTKLNWSAYYFEMAEFYNDLLKNPKS